MQKFIWMEYEYMCIMVSFIYILVHSHFELHLFPALYTFWFLKKTPLRKNCVTGTVLMIQLTQNFPTCAYIGQNPRKGKPR